MSHKKILKLHKMNDLHIIVTKSCLRILVGHKISFFFFQGYHQTNGLGLEFEESNDPSQIQVHF